MRGAVRWATDEELSAVVGVLRQIKTMVTGVPQSVWVSGILSFCIRQLMLSGLSDAEITTALAAIVTVEREEHDTGYQRAGRSA